MHVLVTGANGHLGFNLMAALLAAGYRVRAGVRSLADTSKITRLKQLGDVELVEAELNRPDQMRAAMDGIELLFHTAAVYAIVVRGQATEVLNASIKGAETALRAAADAGVQKVVMTSSVVALPMVKPGAPPVDETRWADDFRVPYVRAKAEAEKLAWQLARELSLNLVTILPGGITGPGFARNTPTINLIEAMMKGAMRLAAPAGNFTIVDVRDVARAHVLAAEQDCEGRFIVSNDRSPSYREIVAALHAIDPSISLSLSTIPDLVAWTLPLFDRINHRILRSPLIATSAGLAMMKGKIWNVSNQRAKEVLGWRPTITLEQTLRDTMVAINARDGDAVPANT